MKVIVLHVEVSRDARTFYGEVADVLEALGEQHFGDGGAKRFLHSIAEVARAVEGLYQHRQFLRRIK